MLGGGFVDVTADDNYSLSAYDGEGGVVGKAFSSMGKGVS